MLLTISEVIADNHQEYFEKANDLATQGKWQDAIEAYDLAIKYKSNFVEAYYNKGVALEKLGRYQEAKEVFNRAKYLSKN